MLRALTCRASRTLASRAVVNPTMSRHAWGQPMACAGSRLRFLSTTTPETETVEKKPSPPTASETIATETQEEHTFQAETAQLLQIVAKSLYTDKEVTATTLSPIRPRFCPNCCRAECAIRSIDRRRSGC
jgi:hypothetical protein